MPFRAMIFRLCLLLLLRWLLPLPWKEDEGRENACCERFLNSLQGKAADL
jgi:hypothetical protein